MLLSGKGKGLAGESPCDDINHSLIRCGVPFTNECSDIAKDGSDGQDSIEDALADDSLAVIVVFGVRNRDLKKQQKDLEDQLDDLYSGDAKKDNSVIQE